VVFRVHSVDARPRRPGWVHGRHAVLEVAELRQRRGVEEDLPAAVVLPGFAGDHPAGLDARLARAAGLVELERRERELRSAAERRGRQRARHAPGHERVVTIAATEVHAPRPHAAKELERDVGAPDAARQDREEGARRRVDGQLARDARDVQQHARLALADQPGHDRLERRRRLVGEQALDQERRRAAARVVIERPAHRPIAPPHRAQFAAYHADHVHAVRPAHVEAASGPRRKGLGVPALRTPRAHGPAPAVGGIGLLGPQHQRAGPRPEAARIRRRRHGEREQQQSGEDSPPGWHRPMMAHRNPLVAASADRLTPPRPLP
jgi:hypothetical protein